MLRHKHDWVAKQQVQIDVTQQISVMAALEKADQRIIDIEVTDAATPLLSGGGRTPHVAPVVREAQERS